MMDMDSFTIALHLNIQQKMMKILFILLIVIRILTQICVNMLDKHVHFKIKIK